MKGYEGRLSLFWESEKAVILYAASFLLWSSWSFWREDVLYVGYWVGVVVYWGLGDLESIRGCFCFGLRWSTLELSIRGDCINKPDRLMDETRMSKE